MRKIIFSILLFICLSFSAYGAFNSPFLENKTMKLFSDQIKDYEIRFVNTEDEYANYSIEIINGQEYLNMSEVESGYVIEPKGKQWILIKVKVPEGAEIGTRTKIEYRVKSTILRPDTGMIGIQPSMKKHFYVEVVAETPEWLEEQAKAEETRKLMEKHKKQVYISISVAVLLIIVIIWLILHALKKKKHEKKPKKAGTKAKGKK